MPAIITSSEIEIQARGARATLSLFHGGMHADAVVRRTTDMTAAAARRFAAADTGKILYINTLTGEQGLENELRKSCRANGGATSRAAILAFTVPADDLLRHAEFLERTIEASEVKLVVLNSFEFAAMSPRRRMRLVAFLQRLRDFSNVHVIVGVRREPMIAEKGAMDFLRFQCAEITKLEEMTEFAEAEETETKPSVVEQNESRSSTVARSEAESRHERATPILHDRSLKTNDLTKLSDTAPEYRQAA